MALKVFSPTLVMASMSVRRCRPVLKQARRPQFIADNPLTPSEETELEAFVNAGHGVYLTGDEPASEALDNSDSVVVNALVDGGGIEVGGQGDADSASAPNSVNSSAIDEVAMSPSQLTSWTPDEPGGLADVGASNVLTSTSFAEHPTPTGAVWDGTSLLGREGRLAILMHINWLELEFWDSTTATQMALNMQRFLISSLPVPAKVNASWAGFAAKAHGVGDVTGEWTVPPVDCNHDASASAGGMWVGIDGFGNIELVMAGLGVTCSAPTSPPTVVSPCYYLFTEVLPGAESPITDGCTGLLRATISRSMSPMSHWVA